MIKFEKLKMPGVIKERGFLLVEIIVSTAIITIVILALFVSYNLYFSVALTNTERIQATFLLEETIEAVKAIRDSDWNTIANLTSGSTYYLDPSGYSWTISNSPVSYIDGTFERKFSVENVARNGSKDIDPTGTNDSGTRKVNATVSWIGRNHATTSVTVSTYITNIH